MIRLQQEMTGRLFQLSACNMFSAEPTLALMFFIILLPGSKMARKWLENGRNTRCRLQRCNVRASGEIEGEWTIPAVDGEKERPVKNRRGKRNGQIITTAAERERNTYLVWRIRRAAQRTASPCRLGLRRRITRFGASG